MFFFRWYDGFSLKLGGYMLATPRGRKRHLLRPYLNDLMGLREQGYSYQQISDWLASKGISFSKDALRLAILQFSKERDCGDLNE